MKKNLALILALVMLMGTIFPVISVAAEATPPAAASNYEPKISYANISYSDKMYMMFAIPAPEALDTGCSVQLLVWANKGDGQGFGITDQNKTVLVAEADKVTIGGAQYLVYKYGNLSAADMTTIIAARPAVVKTVDGATSVVKYGDLVEYSVLEYVANAKGEFGGTKLADDVLATLDSLLAFGGFAQKYSGKGYDFLASDELSKIWYVPVINGVAGEKIFGGFFKKGAELATVSAPHLDNYSFVSYLDKDGKAVLDVDGDVTNGDQVMVTAEGDLEIRVSYGIQYMGKADANKASTNVSFIQHGAKNTYNATQGGLGMNPSSPGTDVSYAGFNLVDDPYVAGNKVYKIIGNHPHSLGLGNSTAEWKASMKVTSIPGFGDTVAPLATIDITIARGDNGEILQTGALRVRNQGSSDMFNIGYFQKDGTFMLYTDGTKENPTALPTKVAEKGWTRYVFIIDLALDVLYVYAGDVNSELVYQGQTTEPYLSGTFASKNNWMEIMGVADVRIEWVGGGTANKFSDVELGNGRFADVANSGLILADLNGDGVGETPMLGIEKNDDGSFKIQPVMETVPVYEKNDDGTNKLDDKGQPIPVLDADGKAVTEQRQATDDKGQLLYEYVLTKDSDGKNVINKEASDWCFDKYRAFYLKEYCTYVGSPVADLPGIILPEVHEHKFVDGKCECGEEDPDYIAPAVAQALYRQYRALLIKDWDSYIGYAGQSVETIYNIDANSANVPSKNSQQMTANFTDDKLATYYKGEGYDGQTLTLGGLGMNAAQVDTTNTLSYAGIDVIDDPYQAGNKIYSWNGGVVKEGATLGALIWHGKLTKNAAEAYVGSLSATKLASWATTPVITYDMTVGGNGYDRMLETDTIRFRGASDTFVHLFKIAADGSIIICKPNADYTDAEFVDTGVDVKKNGYTRIVAEVDFANKTFKLYAADEGAELVLLGTVSDNLWITKSGISHNGATANTLYKDAENWQALASKIDRTEIAAAVGEANVLTNAELGIEDEPAHEHKFVEGKCECGESDPNYIAPATAQAMYQAYRALLIKDWDSYVGYAGNYTYNLYNIDANSANVPSKNSQLLINNFTDDKLATYYKGEGYDGQTLTLGGLGMNAAKADVNNPLSYAGIDVIDDPYQAGNKVYSFNGGVMGEGESLGAVIWHGKLTKNAAEAYVGSLSVASGDAKTAFTETPVLTYDMTVGGNGYDRMLETDTIRFRGASNTYVHLFKIAADGSILVCQPNATYTDAEFVDTGVDVKKNGYTRIVAEVDCENKVFKLYAADEGAELQVIATVADTLWVTSSGISHGAATPLDTYKDDWKTLASKLDRTEIAAAVGAANTLTEAELATADSFKK